MTNRALRSLEVFSALYIGDYFTDTLEFSAEDHHAFRLLLMHVWLTGVLPEEKADFAELAGAPLSAVAALQRTLNPLLTGVVGKIKAWKQALDAFDAKRLPPECWRIMRAVVLERDGYVCAYCGSENNLHVDHRLALSKGGTNRFDNLITSCAPCNLSKGPKSLARWGGSRAIALPSPPRIWENGRPYSASLGGQSKDAAVPLHSAGILLYRRRRQPEVFLVHMGGPLWSNKDAQAWSIPKGLITEGEDALAAARREFFEETRFKNEGRFESLGTFPQNSKKLLTIWALPHAPQSQIHRVFGNWTIDFRKAGQQKLVVSSNLLQIEQYFLRL